MGIENNTPFVSIIIPCRNEQKFIGNCLDSAISNDYPSDKLEVLVVDGMSEDRTRDIVREYNERYPYIKMLRNPKKVFPSAINIGIRDSSGELIIIMSAHSTFDRTYISQCVRYMGEYGADNVGGVLKIMPGDRTSVAQAIALSLSHPFGSGNAYVKIGSKKPRWADTVAFGCYKKAIFEKIGLFNENLLGSADMDFNIRLKKSGGKILLVPGLLIRYYADVHFISFWRHNFADGVWATYVMKFKSKAWSLRHWVPLFFVSSLIGSTALSPLFAELNLFAFGIISAYAIANIGSSVQIAIRENQLKHVFYLPVAFGIRHFAHGFGGLFGLFLVAMPGTEWKGRRSGKGT